MKHIITFNNDIKKYPPIISNVNTLCELGEEVVILGYCSDNEIINGWIVNGVRYIEVLKDDTLSNSIVKFFRLFLYKHRVKKAIKNHYSYNETIVWVFNTRNVWLLHKVVKKYKAIVYLFEMPEFNVSIRFRLLSPALNYFKTMTSAWKVVCCEYNRAALTKSYFQLENMPYIIQNKPSVNIDSIPSLKSVDRELYELMKNKKIILYQGIFNHPERKLDGLCESVDYLPDDYIVMLMGGEGIYRERLIKKYESKRVVFVNFKSFPEHLSVTMNAYIGYLSYHSKSSDLYQSLNTLYCAPNKVFEYSLCGLPIVSNDLPAMRNIFSKYKFGTVTESCSPKAIADSVLKISDNYIEYNSSCDEFFNSFDLKYAIKQLIKE